MTNLKLARHKGETRDAQVKLWLERSLGRAAGMEPIPDRIHGQWQLELEHMQVPAPCIGYGSSEQTAASIHEAEVKRSPGSHWRHRGRDIRTGPRKAGRGKEASFI